MTNSPSAFHADARRAQTVVRSARRLARPPVRFLAGALLSVSVPIGCGGDSATSDTTVVGEVDGWLADIPEPPDADKISSSVDEGSFGAGASAGWTGSISTQDWPGLDQYLDAYGMLLADAGFVNDTDTSTVVAGNTRRTLTYSDGPIRLTVIVTEQEAFAGIVLDATGFD